MKIIPAPVSELDLHAWADGALSPERSALVEAWLRAHPAAAEEVRHWRLQSDALRLLYPLPEPETMNAALRCSVERAGGAAQVASPDSLSPAAPGSASPLRRVAGIAAVLALVLAVWAAVAFHGGQAVDSLADRALRLHEAFRHASAEPVSLAGVGSAGPNRSGAGFALRGVRPIPAGAARHLYEGRGGARLAPVVGSRPESQEQFSVIPRGDTALVGWQDWRAAFVLVGPAPAAAGCTPGACRADPPNS